MTNKIIIIGSGNAAMCAGIAALERGASVVMYEKAEKNLAGGNTKYTAGAMRFCFDGLDSLRDLLKDPEDERLKITDFGSYTESKFAADLLNFNDGRPLSEEQECLISQSHEAMSWLSSHGVKSNRFILVNLIKRMDDSYSGVDWLLLLQMKALDFLNSSWLHTPD